MRKLKLVLSLVFISSILTFGIPLLINSQSFTAAQTLGEDWTTPSNITSLTGDNYLGQADRAIAVDSVGNLHVVYSAESDNEAGNYEIYYATNAGGSWSMVNVSRFNDTSYACFSPVIAVAPNGVVHLAWEAGAIFTNYDIYYANNSGGTWSTPVNITDTATLYEFAPALVVGADNRVHLVYEQAIGWIFGEYSLIYTNHTVADGWSTPENIISSFATTYYISNKKTIDLNPSGIAYVAFAASFSFLDSVDYIFLANNSGGTWGAPVNVSQMVDIDYLTQNNPTMDIDRLGNIHILFDAYNASDQQNFVYTYYSQGTWAAPQNINVSNYLMNGASLTTDVYNKVHIAFAQSNATGGDYDVYYTTNMDGTFIDPVNITNNEGMDEINPHLVLDTQGHANIIFVNTTADQYVQYVRSLYSVVPADYTAIIIIGVVVAVVVVAGVTVYLWKFRAPK